jgi:hypothetical protein
MSIVFPKFKGVWDFATNRSGIEAYGAECEAYLYPYLQRWFANTNYIVIWKGDPEFRYTGGFSPFGLNKSTFTKAMSKDRDLWKRVVESDDNAMTYYDNSSAFDFEILYNPNEVEFSSTESKDDINRKYRDLFLYNMNTNNKYPPILLEIKSRNIKLNGVEITLDDLRKKYLNNEDTGFYEGLYLPSDKRDSFEAIQQNQIFTNTIIYYAFVDKTSGESAICKIKKPVGDMLSKGRDTTQQKAEASETAKQMEKKEFSRDIRWEYWSVFNNAPYSLFTQGGMPQQPYFSNIKSSRPDLPNVYKIPYLMKDKSKPIPFKLRIKLGQKRVGS